MGYFDKKTVWVTGASSGIGRAMAIALSLLDCQLILSSRKESDLLAIKEQSPNPNSVALLPFDLSEITSHAEICKKAFSFFDKVDILIHNAGISQRSLVAESILEVDRRVMEVNYFGTISLTKQVLPLFKAQKSGHFAVITSLTGKFGTPYRSSYAASKHALHGFFESLYLEEYQNGIAVSLICPGFVNTNISYNALQGNNTPLSTLDQAQANGMDPDKFASIALKKIAKQRYESYIGGKETAGIWIKRISIALFLKIIKRSKVR